jgi:hypothetical protein
MTTPRPLPPDREDKEDTVGVKIADSLRPRCREGGREGHLGGTPEYYGYGKKETEPVVGAVVLEGGRLDLRQAVNDSVKSINRRLQLMADQLTKQSARLREIERSLKSVMSAIQEKDDATS